MILEAFRADYSIFSHAKYQHFPLDIEHMFWYDDGAGGACMQGSHAFSVTFHHKEDYYGLSM
jgi:hypothetical protein